MSSLRDKMKPEERERERAELRQLISRDIRAFEDISIGAKRRRRDRAATDFDYFRATYLPDPQRKPDSDMHLDIINQFVRPEMDSWLSCIIGVRGFGKTTLMRELLLWDVLYDRRKFAVVIQSNESAAADWIDWIKAHFEVNERILCDFGTLRDPDHWQAKDLWLTNNSRILARGRKQRIRGLNWRGYRPDAILIDDLVDKDSVRNHKLQSDTYHWILEDCFPALASDNQSLLLDVGNWLDPKSSTALLNKHILDQTAAESNEHEAYPGYTAKYAAEIDGVPMWPEGGYDMPALRKMRKTMGDVAYMREMLNISINPEALFQPEYFDTNDYGIIWGADRINRLEALAGRVAIYLDASVGDSKKNDYKAIVAKMHCKDDVRRIVGCWIRHASLEQMLDAMIDTYLTWQDYAPIVGIEGTAFQQLIKPLLLARLNNCGISAIPIRVRIPKLSKPARIESMAGKYEQGLIELDSTNGDTNILIEQYLGYGNPGMHDDGPDADEGTEWLLDKYGGSTTQSPPLLGGRLNVPAEVW